MLIDLWPQTKHEFLCPESWEAECKEYLSQPRSIEELTKTTYHGTSPLLLAVMNGLLDVVKILIDTLPRHYLLQGDNKGNTPLHCACISDKGEVVKLLLTRLTREECVMKEEKYGFTPLHFACQYSPSSAIALLGVLNQDDLKIQSRNGNTPLHIAHAEYCNQGQKSDVMISLIRRMRPRDLLIRNKHGESPDFEYMGRNMPVMKMAFAKLEPSPELTWRVRSQSFSNREHMDFITRYCSDPVNTRIMLRRELGLAQDEAAECFSLVVGLCDDYFELLEPENQEFDGDAARFFEIARKLPMELQMLLCNRTFDCEHDVIKAADIDAAITRMYD